MPYLIFSIRQGEEIGRRPLDGPTVIGRSPECEVAINDGQLSRRHCRLMPTEAGWVLSDLDSRNGTKFRGHRISRHVLREGDVFQIGLLNVTFRAADMSAGSEDPDRLGRPTRPATPFDAPRQTAAAFVYEPAPPSRRDIEAFPVPIPIATELDWLDVSDELPPVESAAESLPPHAFGDDDTEDRSRLF